MSETLTPEMDEATANMLATVAAGLNGGRYVSRISDERILMAARAIVEPRRVARRKLASAKRQASKRERIAAERAQRAEWLATWRDYSDDDKARMESVFSAYENAPKRSLLRRIAKRLLRTHPENGIVHSDTASCYCPDCLPMDDWRSTVRAYSAAQRIVRDAGSFAISRADMSTSADSRFYRNVVKHWHKYAGGKHIALNGVTPDDVLQDAFLSAIESGDTVAHDTVPVFGSMYMHTRQATESAVYTYRRGHAHSETFTQWTWADWEAWAAERIDPAFRVRYSTDAEWQAYDAARLSMEARQARDTALARDREVRMGNLEESRKALATLVLGGMTVRRIANLLGRTVESLADGLTSEAPAIAWVD